MVQRKEGSGRSIPLEYMSGGGKSTWRDILRNTGDFAKSKKGLCDMRTAKEFVFWDDFIKFCQRLIQTPSLSGEEGEVAQLIREEMKRLHSCAL